MRRAKSRETRVVPFGRVAGAACAKYMLGERVKATSLADLSGGGLSEKMEAQSLQVGR